MSNVYSIYDLPKEDRPRERLAKFGAESLSTVELIALILGSGTKSQPVLQLAHEILRRFGTLKGLSEGTLSEFLEVKGVGTAKAMQLKAALSLGLRASKVVLSARYRIEHPSHAYHLIKDEMESYNREHFLAIFQDVKGFVIAQEVISIGSISQTIVHPREVFYPAIRHKAATIIVAHNHPSGDPTPSEQDIALTKSLIEAGRLIGIPLQDHLIIGRDQYVSLRQRSGVFTR